MWRVGQATDDEGLRLILAFFSIDEPRKRGMLIELAECFARDAHPDHAFASWTSRGDAERAQMLLQDNEQISDKK